MENGKKKMGPHHVSLCFTEMYHSVPILEPIYTMMAPTLCFDWLHLGGKKLGVAPTTGASTMENPALHPDPGVLTLECSLCIFQKKKQD